MDIVVLFLHCIENSTVRCKGWGGGGGEETGALFVLGAKREKGVFFFFPPLFGHKTETK
jgi:hypothetical protein